MSLCYLYSNPSSYPYKKELLDAFDESITLEIETIQTVDAFDTYIIELHQADKEVSQKLVQLFQARKHSLIYFIIPKNHSLLLFQLTFLLEAKSIITHNQNIEKLITKIKADREIFAQNNLERWLGHLKLKTQNFVIYRDSDLIFVNHALLDSFSYKDNNSFGTNILSQVDISKLLQNDTQITIDITSTSKELATYIFKSIRASDDEVLIYIEKGTTQGTQLETEKHHLFSSRITFIELLKENLLHRNINYKELALLTINIQNIKSLLLQYTVVEFEEVLLEMLLFMESILDNKLIFSQFENNFYVVCIEDISFEEINTMTEYFQKKVLNHIHTTNNKIIIDLFTFSLKNHEFSSILTILNKITSADFKEDETNNSYIKHFASLDKKINPKNLLDDAYKEKRTFKILNIYNGLVINTSSKILKITDDSIYISFESLQGVVLNLEKETVIQSESFSQDIHAKVKQISLSKKIAILENFTFLRTNANAREYARVTTPIKIPASISVSGSTVTGVILDISIKSIALKIKYTPKIAILEKTKASIVFNIHDKTAENGYIQLTLSSNIIVVTEVDISGYYKVVCNLDQDSHDLNVILKYVYERQKELIIELKRMAKLN